MKNLLLLFLCICSVYANSGSSSESGSDLCATIKVKPDTSVQDVGPLTGKWYEVSKFGSPNAKICETASYYLTGSNTFSAFVNITSNGKAYLSTGLGVLSAPGILNFNINTRTLNTKNTVYEYQTWSILGTDYFNYLTAYSCSDGIPETTILVRNPNPPKSVWDMAFAAESKNKLPTSYRDVNCLTQSQ